MLVTKNYLFLRYKEKGKLSVLVDFEGNISRVLQIFCPHKNGSS